MSSTKKVLVVFGATGNQGGSVINSILADPSTAAAFQIVGVTRDPSQPSASVLTDRGVVMAKASLDDKDSLRSILRGAYAVFAVTNWNQIKDKEREIQQGKNVADVTKECQVQHLIWSSAPNVSRMSKNKYTQVHHFDAKAAVEEHISSMGIPATFLQLGLYMHFLPYYIAPASPTVADERSYRWVFPILKNTKLPLISVGKDTGRFVKHILIHREEFLGRQVHAAEGQYSAQEIVAILQRAGGLNISLQDHHTEKKTKEYLLSRGVPEVFHDGMIENAKFFDELGYYDGDLDDKILPEPLQSFDSWVSSSEVVAVLRDGKEDPGSQSKIF